MLKPVQDETDDYLIWPELAWYGHRNWIRHQSWTYIWRIRTSAADAGFERRYSSDYIESQAGFSIRYDDFALCDQCFSCFSTTLLDVCPRKIHYKLFWNQIQTNRSNWNSMSSHRMVWFVCTWLRIMNHDSHCVLVWTSIVEDKKHDPGTFNYYHLKPIYGYYYTQWRADSC